MVMHGLYRFWSADDELLYIGISRCPLDRIDQHVWTRGDEMKQVSRIEVVWFDDREEGRAAEVAAIKAEQPRWNMAHRAIKAARAA